MKGLAILTLISVLPFASALNIVYYSQDRCRGEIITFENITSEDATCRIPTAMKVQPLSVRISNFDSDDYYLHDKTRDTLRFYDTDDCVSNCSHRHVIADTHWNTCVEWPQAIKDGRKMKSFNVVKFGDIGMGRETGAISDGICRLEHGDTLFYRNQYWRMQQVAAAWFRDIPEDEWDPLIHVKNTTVRFGEHGDIDAFGKYKLRNDWDWLDNIALEYWDDEDHFERKSWNHWNIDAPEFYDDLVSELCEEATRTDVNRALLLAKIPNVDDICKNWKSVMVGIEDEGAEVLHDYDPHAFVHDSEDSIEELK